MPVLWIASAFLLGWCAAGIVSALACRESCRRIEAMTARDVVAKEELAAEYREMRLALAEVNATMRQWIEEEKAGRDEGEEWKRTSDE